MDSTYQNRGNAVEVKTFINWGASVCNNMGYKTEERQGRTYVNYVWCRLCARYKDQLVAHPNLRGAARKSAESYAVGTNSVTKSNTLRHLDGKAHQIALLLDSGEGKELGGDTAAVDDPNGDVTVTGPTSHKQPRIDHFMDQASRDAYTKLLSTAYELALNAMPFRDFKILVKIQKKNGVSLVKGKDDTRVARELVTCLSTAIKEKIAVILLSKKVFSSLSDGSQARKSGADKELIFIRVERDGKPVYYCIGLEDLSDHGGANAEGIKAAHDKVFSFVGEQIYTEGMVSCTADGASVNFGRWEGFLTKMSTTRPWLLMLHCVNHRAELAAKGVFEKNKQSQEIDELYIGIRNLLKNSGRLKSEVKCACESLNVTYYSLQKIHGTRFQHQRRKGFKRFLHMWIPLSNTFENALCQPANNYRPDTRAKIAGYLKKLKRLDVLVNLSYFDILETIGILSLTFEKETVLISDVEPARDRTIGQLDDMLEESVSESQPSKHFDLETDSDGTYHIVKRVPFKGNERKNMSNRAYTKLSMTVTNVAEVTEKLQQLKQKVIGELKEKYISRFDSFDDGIIKAMMFIDPKFWDMTERVWQPRCIISFRFL